MKTMCAFLQQLLKKDYILLNFRNIEFQVSIDPKSIKIATIFSKFISKGSTWPEGLKSQASQISVFLFHFCLKNILKSKREREKYKKMGKVTIKASFNIRNELFSTECHRCLHIYFVKEKTLKKEEIESFLATKRKILYSSKWCEKNYISKFERFNIFQM